MTGCVQCISIILPWISLGLVPGFLSLCKKLFGLWIKEEQQGDTDSTEALANPCLLFKFGMNCSEAQAKSFVM